MPRAEAEALVERYVGFMSGEPDAGFEDMLAEDFFDHVSGRRGAGIWAQVASWMTATFADPQVDVHDVMTRADRLMVWMTVTATHVGAGFPRLRDVSVTGKRVAWMHVHIFRVSDGRITEHRAVRDDYGMSSPSLVQGLLSRHRSTATEACCPREYTARIRWMALASVSGSPSTARMSAS